MEGGGTSEVGFLTSLPNLGVFLGIGGPLLILIAGVLFRGRESRTAIFLRRLGEGTLRTLVMLILCVMVVLSGLQIVLRNLFDSGLLWIDPLLRHLVLLLAFSGALLATGAKRHIQIDVLGRLLKGWASRIVGAGIALGAGSICLTLAHGGLRFLQDEIEFAETVFLGLPTWGVAAVFPVAFLALGFRFYYLAYLEMAGEAPQPVEIDPAEDEEEAPASAGSRAEAAG